MMFTAKRAIACAAIAGAMSLSGAVFADEELASVDPTRDYEHVSCKSGENEIRVLVTGVKQGVGLIVADLYGNDEEGFLKKAGRVQQVRFAAKAPNTFFCFNPPEPELYAIAVYHDENANQTFDKGAFGIPVEPFGISNNPKLRLRAPKISEAAFEVAKEGTTVEIIMKN